MSPDKELIDSFLAEARDYLAEIRSQLEPALEGQHLSPARTEALGTAVHSLKGVSGLLGFTHLHALVNHLERSFAVDEAGPSGLPVAPALANAAVHSLEQMIQHIAAGHPEANEEVLLDFELGAEIFVAVAARGAQRPVPRPKKRGDLTSVDDGTLAAALAEDASEVSGATTTLLLPTLEATRPGPRQVASAEASARVMGLVSSADMAGREDLAAASSVVAGVLSDIAAGRRLADDETMDLAMRGLSMLGRLAAPEPSDAVREEAAAIVEEARVTLEQLGADDREETGEIEGLDEALEELRGLFVEEALEHLAEADAALTVLEAAPDDDDAVRRFFRATHTLKGAAGTVGLADVMKAAHALEDLFASVADGRREVDAALVADTRSQVAALRAQIAGGEALLNVAPVAGSSQRSGRTVRVPQSRLDALMLGAADLLAARARAVEARSRFSAIQSLAASRRQQIAARLLAYERGREMGDPTDAADPDHLVADLADLDFHLAEALASLARVGEGLEREVDEIARLAGQIQEGLVRARFVPLADLFQRFVHSARDWARSESKELEVVVDATSAEVDRAVADAIADPLVHLVRNAVTHGIERPGVREAAGKPPTGTLVLRAREEGRDVIVEVEDDGRGLDPAALREAAVSRGLMTEDEAADGGARIIEIIFAPGFSTRDSADAMAGRGVGLDVVATAVSRLGGILSVAPRPNGGTIFSARVPATMAILPVLSLAGAGHVLAVPVAAVRETILVDRRELEAAREGAHVRWRGEALRVVTFPELLGLPAPAQSGGPRRLPVVVVGHKGRNAALVVDRILAREEGMVRGLGPILDPLPVYASAVVGGDGRVRLVLDVSFVLSVAMGTRTPTRQQRPPVRRAHAPRVLVVDDSRSVRTELARLLRSAGYEVEVAADGQAALDRLHVDRYDLVLTDLEMPRLHGFELLERMREDSTLSAIPALVISSRAGPRHRERALALGARAFLTKPVTREALLERLGAWLS